MHTRNVLITAFLILASLPAQALNFAQSPLFIASTEPRIMLVASRDHQLSIKAYTDYSDLDGDGVLDTTYKDSITYTGYFDSNRCYDYNNSRFEPGNATSPGGHECGGSGWSGNFLNWATMTRMDILRKTFYGGKRSTDTTSNTVLERHFLPNDVHAFVKVFDPGSNAILKKYLPNGVVGSNTAISLCNVSDSTNTNLTGTTSFTMPAPSIKVAAGAWPQWDSSEVTQCAVNIGNSTQPTSVLGTYNARVQVCVSGKLEANCKTYTDPNTNVQTRKPVGLLQQYGDVDADRRVRFGLMTGSYNKNKSGGVLRKNTSFLSNNNNVDLSTTPSCSSTSGTTANSHANDEIDFCTGQFLRQGASDAGIINTLNRLRIAGYKYTSSGGNGSHQYSCNSPGITSFSDGQCVDWGNPLSEIYLESLRYFANVGASTAFNTSDSGKLDSLPQVSWADPLPATEWCALSSIVVLSTGLNSFDTDQLSSFTPSGGSAFDAATLTQTVGSKEGINGGTYLIGDNGSTADNQCTAKAVGNLANARGVCPEVPSMQGGYGIAGLAYGPKALDLRPGYLGNRQNRWGGANPINADWAARQPLSTYTVQLAESLPSFKIPVGTGNITFLPACQAFDGTPGSWPATSGGKTWRNCSMTNLVVDTKVPSGQVGTDSSAKTRTCSGGPDSQCFTVMWEDSTWGNDYDMDGIQRLGYCVGSSCDTFRMLCPSTSSAVGMIGVGLGNGWSSGSTAAGQMRIVTCAIQANAGHSLTFGYTVAGTPAADGVHYPIYRPGGSASNNFNVGNKLPSAVSAAKSDTYIPGSSTASLLQNPLWYAAKYGGFTESTPTAGTPEPDLASEWDADNDGIPDTYFDVKNPANLATAMRSIFDAASKPDASAASVATNSTSLQSKSRVYQARFSSADWSGQLLQFPISTSGLLGFSEWDAGSVINGQNAGSRVIITKKTGGGGVAFHYGNLDSTQQTALNKNKSGTTDNCGYDRVEYLRGNQSHEGANGTFTCTISGTNTIDNFRVRSSKLGDIVNSNPWYVGAPAADYADAIHPGYSAFRGAKLSRTPVVYVGGNDGMLHAVDASLTFPSGNPIGTITSTSGSELLAYVPSSVYGKLSQLTDKNYNKDHLYYVDSSPMVGDADVGSGGTPDWRSVLVGAMGAGGKGVFALDVSDPATFTEANAANILLWEFTEVDDSDMGYVFNNPPMYQSTSQPKQMVKMANGKWAVILGNGYNSTAGKAALYVLFIKEGMDGTWTTGTDYIKIVVDSSGNNGLSTPVPFDTDSDGVVDVVYAGDLKGNMWKFLVGDASPSNWTVDFSASGCGAMTCTPLFKAQDSGGNPQPIVWPAVVSRHMTEPGVMVLFGTGKYLENADNGTTGVQSFYGIWDKNDNTTTVGTGSTHLLQQTVTGVSTITSGGVNYNYRTVSSNAISAWGNTTGQHMGWYLDLPTSGERTTGIPKLDKGMLFFNTFIPSTSPCEAGGTGWLMAMNYLTGGNPNYNVFTQNAPTTPVAGFQVGAALGGSTLIQGAHGSKQGVVVSSLTTGALVPTPVELGTGIPGRVSWRELVQ